MDVASLLWLADDAGIVLREYEGQLNMSSRGGSPDEEVVRLVRKNKRVLMEAVRLQQRLTNGERKCEVASDEELGQLETLWFRLLGEYETICSKSVYGL